MRPLLIGEASKRSDVPPFWGRPGRFLASLVGLGLEEFLAKVEAINLLDRWPGKAGNGKGDAFPAKEAADAASKLHLDGRIVLAAGQRVAAALGLKEPIPLLQPVSLNGSRVWVIPHPSGIVTWWNDPKNKRRAAEVLREVLGRGERKDVVFEPEKLEDRYRLWKGMPSFAMRGEEDAWKSITVNFRNAKDMDDFAKVLGQRITDRTRSIWHPRLEPLNGSRWVSSTPQLPRYPVYIPTKGRVGSPYTIKAFDRIGMPYRIVVEPQEKEAYSAIVDPSRILTLPFRDKGVTAARNWIWDHASKSGTKRYWTFDDNIKDFWRLTDSAKDIVCDPTIFRIIEDWVDRFENVVVAGCQYYMFAPRKAGNMPPVVFNTRVYSNMLIETDLKDRKGRPARWECYFNEDTDLCLRVLKDGQCTALFNAFLARKQTTMTVKGGNTGNYQGDGRFRMAKELKEKHPDVVTITEKWGRVQHQVDYSPFARNRPKLVPGAEMPEDPNRGMELVPRPVFACWSSKVGSRFSGKAARFLADLLGSESPEVFTESHPAVLTLSLTKRGTKLSERKVQDRVEKLLPKLKGRPVFVLGERTAEAFGFAGMSPLEERSGCGACFVLLPEVGDSWWNSADDKNNARRTVLSKARTLGRARRKEASKG